MYSKDVIKVPLSRVRWYPASCMVIEREHAQCADAWKGMFSMLLRVLLLKISTRSACRGVVLEGNWSEELYGKEMEARGQHILGYGAPFKGMSNTQMSYTAEVRLLA